MPENTSASGMDSQTQCPLPVLKSKSSITLMVKNPLWGFAYWEIDPAELKAVMSGLPLPIRQTRTRIRIFNLQGDPGSGFNKPFFFDEEVKEQSGSCDIRFGINGARYYIELGLWIQGNSRFIPLCRSNTIGPFPPHAPADHEHEKWVVPDDTAQGYKEVKACPVKGTVESLAIWTGSETSAPQGENSSSHFFYR